MAAQQVIYGQVFVNSIGGKTIVVDVDCEVTTQDLKIKIQEKTNIPPEKQVLTFEGKVLENDRKMSDYNIMKESTIFLAGRIHGGVGWTEEQLKQILESMNNQIVQLQAQLTSATAQSSNKPRSTPSIIEAIRKGQMKEIAPKKFANAQTSGGFKAWAKDMKEYIFWHDKETKQLIENFEVNWKVDERLTYIDVQKCCSDNGVELEVDKALHMILGAFLEGESKILSETAELSNPFDLEMHKSGLELWRLLRYNFDRSSAFNVISILESIRNMQAAKSIQEVLPKITLLERSHQEYARQAVASKDPEFIKMRTHGVSVYPEVFKKAYLLKVLPESIVKELKKNTNINFESDRYTEIRDIVTTIVHNHMNTSVPMDVDKKHVMSLDKTEGDTDMKEEEAHQEEAYPGYSEEGGVMCYIGKGGGWQTKGKGKSKGRFDGVCYNCGKTGHRSRECWGSKGNWKGEQKGKGNETGKGAYQQGGKGFGGKGKGINVFEGQAFAPQPQPVAVSNWQSHPADYGAHRLMTTNWNGYGGNFGGLNLCCIGPKAQTCDRSHHNRFRVLESEDIDDASDDAKPGDDCDKGTLAVNVERKVMPRKYTIGDAIQIAKTRVAKKQRSSRAEGQRILDELVADKTDDPLVVLACLLPQSTYTQADAGPSLCTNIHDEYEKIEMMIDSGASETVASQDKFSSYPLVETTASGTTYSSAAEKDVEQIINVGQKYVQVVDSRGNESWAKFQMCKGL